MAALSSPPWDPQFAEHSPMFEPLRPAAARLSQSTWPSREQLTRLAAASEPPVANAGGQPIRFSLATPPGTSAADYERSIARDGTVAHRDACWHDLFNALAWITFPKTKAALNRAHVSELAHETTGRRTRTRDRLTQLDEDGLLVVSEQEELLALLRRFQWRELFWNRRREVKNAMGFFVLGHAHYEKALQPFVGMTAKALTICVPPRFCSLPYLHRLDTVDRLAAEWIDRTRCSSLSPALAPVPVLGIPGWSAESDRESFYDNTRYFRSGRRCTAA